MPAYRLSCAGQDKVCDVDCEKRKALPAFKFGSNDHGDHRDTADQKAGGKIQSSGRGCNGKRFSGKGHADRQNQCEVNNVCPENIADRQRGLLFDNGGYGSDKFRQRGAHSY